MALPLFVIAMSVADPIGPDAQQVDIAGQVVVLLAGVVGLAVAVALVLRGPSGADRATLPFARRRPS